MTALDQPTAVRPGEELAAERLAPYLHQALDLAGDLTVEQFPSGFSNLTYLLRLDDRQLVLRRPPFGARIASAHDMGREYRLLSALHPAWGKVPEPLLFCDDEAVLGAPFYVMERIEGVILRSRVKAGQTPSPATVEAAAGALIATLVELHGLDVVGTGLGDLGKGDGYVERQIAGWTKRWIQARTDDLPEMDRAAAWLEENRPPDSAATLIHNDFKYDNLILDGEDPGRVRAVLDWEMATVGDPLMDLGTTLGYWVDPDDPPALKNLALSPTTLPGNPSRRQVAERYAALSGHEVGDGVFVYAYGLFKIAVIVQQIYARYQAGHTQDPRFAGLIHAVRACARGAVQAIERGRIDDLWT
ncbi:MAG: phosphotransferase family protein [Acidobacteriota bacterium]